jgi:hypothetical protein
MRAQSAFGSVVRIVKLSTPADSAGASFGLHHSQSPAKANGFAPLRVIK